MESLSEELRKQFPDIVYRNNGTSGWYALSAASLADDFEMLVTRENIVLVIPFCQKPFVSVDTYCVGQFCRETGGIAEGYLWEYRLERDGLSKKLVQDIGDFLKICGFPTSSERR